MVIFVNKFPRTSAISVRVNRIKPNTFWNPPWSWIPIYTMMKS